MAVLDSGNGLVLLFSFAGHILPADPGLVVTVLAGSTTRVLRSCNMWISLLWELSFNVASASCRRRSSMASLCFTFGTQLEIIVMLINQYKPASLCFRRQLFVQQLLLLEISHSAIGKCASLLPGVCSCALFEKQTDTGHYSVLCVYNTLTLLSIIESSIFSSFCSSIFFSDKSWSILSSALLLLSRRLEWDFSASS